ncbi:MAG TPA: hypothetical protein VOA41_08090 [Candidatus Dormibacteraeota bacterium]|nr:hypothetical protein [Candidatus Dormibacteraeota bacterium]
MTGMIKQAVRFALLAGGLAFWNFTLGMASGWAQAKPGGGEAPDTVTAVKNLQFREIGPAVMGGRIDDFAVVESNPNIVYVGTATGGIWKTTNAGTSWEPLFDKQSVSTIGDLALAPSDPAIVWAGTGEPNNRQSSSWGDGIYKSTDSGKTWTKMGLEDTRHIGRVVIHPLNPNTVYVAALGHLWGPNHERGVFKTNDGGKTWTQSLFVNEDTGVSDIAMDPESPETLYAAAYERRRTPYGFVGGGPHGAIYKTTDGGATWRKLAKGLPYETGGDVGRIGLDIFRRNPNIVYAEIQHSKGGVFRSEDKGETWTKMSSTNPRPSYYSQIRIDPNNDLRIWILGAPMSYSEDGGKTFSTRRVTRIHGDFHAMWINPANSNHLIVGSDGGIYWSYDAGRTWDFVNTIPLGQFYEIGVDMQKPYHVCGGLQDNASWCGPSQTLGPDGPINEDWVRIVGGDGFYAQIDPADPNTVYSEAQDGHLLRRNLHTLEARSIMPYAREGEAPYRFQWNSPIVISAFDHNTIYYGGNFVFKSTNRGDLWTRLGPDLTTGVERNKLAILGKIPDKNTLSRADGVQHYPTITSISESPVSAKVLWAGTDDGNLQVTRDDGRTWKNVAGRVPGVPKGTYVSRVIASRGAEGTAYAAFDGHRADDYNVYVFMTTDYGDTWKAISSGIPKKAGSVHVIREHPQNHNLLFAGTEFGMYASWDRGASWWPFRLNLPTVPVYDIAIHPRDNDLIVATHGRSIWILDDLTPIEKINPNTVGQDLALFDSRPATAWRTYSTRWFSGHKSFAAKNPAYGALITYYLKSAVPAVPPKADAAEGEESPGESRGGVGRRGGAGGAGSEGAAENKGKTKITILDKDGKEVRHFDGPGAAGVNRVNWDLRYDPPAQPSAQQLEAQASGFFGFGPRGPLVEPGEYAVKISAAGKDATGKITVEEDSRLELSAADRAARRETIAELYEMAKNVEKGRDTIVGLKEALTAMKNSWKKETEKPNGIKVPDNVKNAMDSLSKKVDELHTKFVPPAIPMGNAGPPLEYIAPPLPGRVESLLAEIGGYTAAPSGQEMQELEDVTKLADDALGKLKKVVDEDLANLNKTMNETGMPHIRILAPVARRDAEDDSEQK